MPVPFRVRRLSPGRPASLLLLSLLLPLPPLFLLGGGALRCRGRGGRRPGAGSRRGGR